MSRILVGSANNLKLNVLGALQLCKKCRSAASFRRGIRLFHNISVKGSVRESKWTFQQTLHWRHRTRLSPNLKTVVCPLSTSPPQDERNTFKDDPEIKAFMKQIHEDFGVDQEINSSQTSANSDDTSSSESDSESSGSESSGSESSDSDGEVDKKEKSSSPSIKEKSEYIIIQDDMVYDYEELDENYQEMEEAVEEVQRPISLERGVTGVFDLPQIVELLQHENAQELCVIKVPEELQYVDHMVIVTARSTRHCQAIGAAVKWFYKQKSSKRDPASVKIEGKEQHSEWLAMDLGNIALHIFMPAERQKYDLESLWTVGTEFDENVQKELALDADPFAAYLKDFGKKTKQIEDQYVQIEKLALKTETSKAPYSKLRTLDSAGGWHSTDR